MKRTATAQDDAERDEGETIDPPRKSAPRAVALGETPKPPPPAIQPFSIAIDSIADASLQARHAADGAASIVCDQCGEVIEGEPSGRGLYLWTRGEEMRFEEPALCPECSVAIGITAHNAWAAEEDDG